MRAAPARQRHLRLGGPTWTALVAAMAAALCNVTAASAEPPAAAGREALARALDWLQTNQGPRGDWNTSSPATASLAALASLAAGHLPARGSRGQIAQGAIEFLTHQIAAGSLGSEAARPDARLDHALAILALTQAYGTCDDARIGQTLDVAVRRLQRNLRADAAAGTSHSIHVLAWHALALESAAQCGLVVTQDAWDALWQLAAACPTPPLDGDAAPPTHAGMPPPPLNTCSPKPLAGSSSGRRLPPKSRGARGPWPPCTHCSRPCHPRQRQQPAQCSRSSRSTRSC